MKTVSRVFFVALVLTVLVLSLSACEGMEFLNGVDGFTGIFNKTTAASTTAAPAVTTAAPATTTAAATTAPPAPKQVLKVEVAPTIDGVIDEAYLESASFATAYQPMRDNAPDPMAMVDPYSSAAMMEILRGHIVTGATSATAKFYFLWGEEEGTPYIYVAIEVSDSTKYERTAAYTSHPNPWINDNLELYYHFGGSAAPSMVGQSSPYPIYNGIVRDAVTGSNLAPVGTPEYHAPTAVAAEMSLYFNQIKCAVSGRDTAGDNTYVIEYRIPAKTEGFSGRPTNTGNFERYEGENLRAGDLVYFTYQINDLTGLPSGYTTTAQYDAKIATFGGAAKYKDAYTYVCEEGSAWRAYEETLAPYVYSAGNSRPSYLNAPGAAPMILQLGE